ncbi:MAG: hypothetical protein AB8G17_19145 [Gammaproteobacteria bacterium]
MTNKRALVGWALTGIVLERAVYFGLRSLLIIGSLIGLTLVYLAQVLTIGAAVQLVSRHEAALVIANLWLADRCADAAHAWWMMAS